MCLRVSMDDCVYPKYNIFLWTYRSKLLVAKTQSLFRQTNSPPATDAEVVTANVLHCLTSTV